MLEGNLGLRISDTLKLQFCDVVRDGDRFRPEVVEQKTGKRRIFTVPLVIQQDMENYCLRTGTRIGKYNAFKLFFSNFQILSYA